MKHLWGVVSLASNTVKWIDGPYQTKKAALEVKKSLDEDEAGYRHKVAGMTYLLPDSLLEQMRRK